MNSDLWQELDQLVNTHEISWHWVKGHSGHVQNELADQLANKGIDELMSGTTRVGPTIVGTTSD